MFDQIYSKFDFADAQWLQIIVIDQKIRLRDHGNLSKNYENLSKIMEIKISISFSVSVYDISIYISISIMEIWSKLWKFDQIIRFMYLTVATAELTASDIPWGTYI